MAKAIVLGVVAAALIGVGWSAGRAQTSQADFEIAIGVEDGWLRVDCLGGCKFSTDRISDRIPSALRQPDKRVSATAIPLTWCAEDPGTSAAGPCRFVGWAEP